MSKVPASFWVLSGVAVIWNLLGVGAYFADVTMSPEDIQKLRPTMQELYATRPAWATAAFALGVFSGLLGSILLLLRKSLAIPVFVISLIAILVQNFYNFGVAGLQADDKMGNVAFAMPALIIVIAIFLIGFARRSQQAGIVI